MPEKWDDIFPITSGINLGLSTHCEAVVKLIRADRCKGV